MTTEQYEIINSNSEQEISVNNKFNEQCYSVTADVIVQAESNTLINKNFTDTITVKM